MIRNEDSIRSVFNKNLECLTFSLGLGHGMAMSLRDTGSRTRRGMARRALKPNVIIQCTSTELLDPHSLVPSWMGQQSRNRPNAAQLI